MDHAVGRAPFSHIERPLEELAGMLAEQIDAVAEPACERSRGKAVAALGFLPLVLLATLWLVPRIDPKGAAYAKSGRFYLGFVIAFTVFMCGMTWLSELTVWGVVPLTGAVGIIVTTAIGVLFIGMGNYLPRVRQNYTMGVKTPWALADPENWQRTQRFGGKCFVVMGWASSPSALRRLRCPMGPLPQASRRSPLFPWRRCISTRI